jgi:hypothetical protein
MVWLDGKGKTDNTNPNNNCSLVLASQTLTKRVYANRYRWSYHQPAKPKQPDNPDTDGDGADRW